jgi:hypothetical protein
MSNCIGLADVGVHRRSSHHRELAHGDGRSAPDFIRKRADFTMRMKNARRVPGVGSIGLSSERRSSINT